ncbi:MAG TPA: DUF4956 domain-containing protein [Acidimicrobiia bacterium]|nr:DUF4956 domain-containing protein [Acidimicrobiia bacterium]
MSSFTLMVIDLIAVALLVFALYFPRHKKREMIVAYLVANVGVVAVANALSTSAIAAGLGLGLFGILSIIRLRSSELDQPEIAYYFASLALGLLAGISVSPTWLSPTMMAVVLVALFVGDHPTLFASYRSQRVTLDRAYSSEAALRVVLEEMLGAKVHRVKVRNVDLVRDTTTVEVRYQLQTRADSAVGAVGSHV